MYLGGVHRAQPQDVFRLVQIFRSRPFRWWRNTLYTCYDGGIVLSSRVDLTYRSDYRIEILSCLL